jgi:A/G-specific adenine glycosylase
MAALSRDAVARIRSALLQFFDESARDLPWRATREPYRVWISEVMLQQTRVEAVLPYYERWLQRYPDLDTLADAPLDDVLKQWEGLGYYSRARNLHATAQVVRERFSGAFPSTYADLRALPGVGDYTAGAISSIAFDAREPAVDGNVKRVLSRVLNSPAPTVKRLRAVAASLVPPDRPGDFNQALMELGARICTPRTPRCGTCPIQRDCRAYAAGTQLQRPRRTPSKTLPLVDMNTVVVTDTAGRMLIVRRGDEGLLARMWNFPAIDASQGDATSLLTQLNIPRIRSLQPLGTIEHVFSHRRERYHCSLVRVARAPVLDMEHAWIGEDTAGYALPRAQQRIHAMALKLQFVMPGVQLNTEHERSKV